MFEKTERRIYPSLYDRDNIITRGAGFVYLFSNSSRFVIILENHTEAGIAHFAVEAHIENPREYDSYVPIISRVLDTSARIQASIEHLLLRCSIAIDQKNVLNISEILRREIDEDDLINPSREGFLELLFATDKTNNPVLYNTLLNAAMTELADVEMEFRAM